MINALSVLREAEAEKEGGSESVEGDLNELLSADEAKPVPVWTNEVSESLAIAVGKLVSVAVRDTSDPWHDISEDCFRAMILMAIEGREKGSNITDTKAMSLTFRYFLNSEPADQVAPTTDPKALKRDALVSLMVKDEDEEVLCNYRVNAVFTKSYGKWYQPKPTVPDLI